LLQDYVQEWVFYGATFFIVEQRQFKDYPSPLILGINCEGVSPVPWRAFLEFLAFPEAHSLACWPSSSLMHV
jgi:hypothetical protein